MKKLVREIPLANGLTVRFFATTRRYFGDYHQVRIEIDCEVPLSRNHFATADEFQLALKELGAAARFLKLEEHQGVPSDQVDTVVNRVVDQFTGHTLRYFSGEEFPRRLVLSELERLRKRAGSFVGRYHG